MCSTIFVTSAKKKEEKRKIKELEEHERDKDDKKKIANALHKFSK